ncbi:hypothetical protein G7061_03215 [Erysipelothrix sp. HDW6B]|uniref:hypothetical protein n=1 Tax=Erysipelothrix TaxID=1647 RepID=UPI001357BA3A|nr:MULTISPECIES: hypothetical protein [Erysipelothrix]QIK85679.1 hypothetical protein G7061_03215 [Erysipelothrix sp. HDW6B]
MTRKIKIAICVVGAIILSIIDWRLGLGWLIGWTSLLTLEHFRNLFYNIILDEQQFTVKKYVGYIIFVFVILWLPLLLAFMFPAWINPYAIAATYLLDRLLLFMTGIFTKEKANVAS